MYVCHLVLTAERVQDVMSSGGKVKHFSPSGGRGTIPSVEWSPANPSAIFGRAVNFTEHHSQPERRVQHSGDAQPNLSTKPKHVSVSLCTYVSAYISTAFSP